MFAQVKMFYFWSLLLASYVICRFIVPLPVTRLARTAIALLIILISEFHLISAFLYGSMFSPEWPQPLMIVLGWMFGAIALFAGFLFLRDILELPLRLIFPHRLPNTITGSFLLAGALLLSAYGLYHAMRIPDVRTIHLTISGLPPAFDGFRIVQLADIHASGLLPAAWVDEVVKKSERS